MQLNWQFMGIVDAEMICWKGCPEAAVKREGKGCWMVKVMMVKAVI